MVDRFEQMADAFERALQAHFDRWPEEYGNVYGPRKEAAVAWRLRYERLVDLIRHNIETWENNVDVDGYIEFVDVHFADEYGPRPEDKVNPSVPKNTSEMG
jgi:hypothetical protein